MLCSSKMIYSYMSKIAVTNGISTTGVSETFKIIKNIYMNFTVSYVCLLLQMVFKALPFM